MIAPPTPTVADPRRKAELDRELDQIAYWLDNRFQIPGLRWRFGLDSIVGLIPGVGDWLTTAISLVVLFAGVRQGVPRATLVRMALNVGVDHLVGSVPVLGDLFDVVWKSNSRNVALLRHHAGLPEAQRKATRGDWLFIGGVALAVVAFSVAMLWLGLWILAHVWRWVSSSF